MESQTLEDIDQRGAGQSSLFGFRISQMPCKPLNWDQLKCSFDSRYRIRDGDLLISWSASLGAFIWDRGEAVLNQHIFRVEVNEERIEKHFLYYLVLHMLDEMALHTHGSTMKHITKRKFEALDVSVPSKKEQRRIVGKIQEVFKRVREIQTLRRDSIADAGALEGAVFSDFILDFTKGANVSIVPLGDIVVRGQYGSSSKANAHGDGVPILRMGNIQSGHLDVSDLKHINLPEKELATVPAPRGRYSLQSNKLARTSRKGSNLYRIGGGLGVRVVPDPPRARPTQGPLRVCDGRHQQPNWARLCLSHSTAGHRNGKHQRQADSTTRAATSSTS